MSKQLYHKRQLENATGHSRPVPSFCDGSRAASQTAPNSSPLLITGKEFALRQIKSFSQIQRVCTKPLHPRSSIRVPGASMCSTEQTFKKQALHRWSCAQDRNSLSLAPHLKHPYCFKANLQQCLVWHLRAGFQGERCLSLWNISTIPTRKMDPIFPSTKDVPAKEGLGSQFYYSSEFHMTAELYCMEPVNIKNSLSYPSDWHSGVFSFHCYGQQEEDWTIHKICIT